MSNLVEMLKAKFAELDAQQRTAAHADARTAAHAAAHAAIEQAHAADRAHDSAITVRYIASTVRINDDNECTFDARIEDIESAQRATHGNLTISLDLLNLLLSADSRVVRETLAMLRDLHAQQFEHSFYDDERDNLKHCIADV